MAKCGCKFCPQIGQNSKTVEILSQSTAFVHFEYVNSEKGLEVLTCFSYGNAMVIGGKRWINWILSENKWLFGLISAPKNDNVLNVAQNEIESVYKLQLANNNW